MVLQPPTILRLGAGPVRLHACQSPAQSGRADMRPAQHPAAAQRAVHKCSSIVSSSCASRASDMHASPWHAAQQAVVGFVRMEAPQNAQVPDTPSWSHTGGCTMALTSARTPYILRRTTSSMRLFVLTGKAVAVQCCSYTVISAVTLSSNGLQGPPLGMALALRQNSVRATGNGRRGIRHLARSNCGVVC